MTHQKATATQKRGSNGARRVFSNVLSVALLPLAIMLPVGQPKMVSELFKLQWLLKVIAAVSI